SQAPSTVERCLRPPRRRRVGRGGPARTEQEPRTGTVRGSCESMSVASGREHLVEDGLGLLLLGVLGERELRDEDLAGLREHALLAGREATVSVAAREVAHDLGDLDDVTR